jgi:hypothetical protein
MRPMDGHRATLRPHLLLYYLLVVGNVVLIRRAGAYPDYLLTRSNCWTELSTNEVIMNFPVVSVAQSDDPQMRIMEITDNETAKDKNNPKVVYVGVRTTNRKTNKDYQYVLDVIEGECTIVGGGCDKNRRIGGRAKDIVKVLLPDEEGAVCTLQAGWAASHEAVRLTPLLDIGAVPDEDEDEEEEEDIIEEELGAEVEEETQDTRTGDQRNEKHEEEEIIHDATLEDPADHSRPEKNKRSVDKKTDPSKISAHHQQHQQHLSYDTVKRKHYEKNLLQYEIGFDRVGLSWTGYVRGAIFLLVAPSLVVCLCLQWSQCTNKQKRRDL